MNTQVLQQQVLRVNTEFTVVALELSAQVMKSQVVLKHLHCSAFVRTFGAGWQNQVGGFLTEFAPGEEVVVLLH